MTSLSFRDIHVDKLQLKRAYDNFPMNKPVEHSSFYSGYLLKPLQWTPEEKSAELEGW